jgi:ABC-type proline/glycine betaine transport system ATPase subunit
VEVKNLFINIIDFSYFFFCCYSIGGKTTCISLLEHFYEPDEGQILIDDIPVENYDYKFYHEKV